MEFDELSNRLIGCAIEVHRELGLGHLESAYEHAWLMRLLINFNDTKLKDGIKRFVL